MSESPFQTRIRLEQRIIRAIGQNRKWPLHKGVRCIDVLECSLSVRDMEEEINLRAKVMSFMLLFQTWLIIKYHCFKTGS
jgi:hypothetical protein